MDGLTVVVVDPDAHSRAQTVSALRTLGLHALGVHLPTDAVALLDGILPDAVLVRAESPDVAALFWCYHTLLVEVAPSASVEDALSAVLRALTRQPAGQQLN
jgi:CheY-like chemotaxis protein